jgi:hypothetical protein
MSNLASIITAVVFTSLVSCIPPEPPPSRFRPNPSLAPDLISPADTENDISPPPSPSELTQPVPPPPTANGGYPTATSTANPDQVLSPYEPYNVIDISGPPHFKSGQLARDPSNKKIFRVP